MSDTHSLFIPMTFRRIGGRKAIVYPDDAQGVPERRSSVEDPLVKAIARAHRWQRLLENGHYSSLADIARDEKISLSFVSRVYRLVLLAPDIIEAIFAGDQPSDVTFKRLLDEIHIQWAIQRQCILLSA